MEVIMEINKANRYNFGVKTFYFDLPTATLLAAVNLNFTQEAGEKNYLDNGDIARIVRRLTNKDPDDTHIYKSESEMLRQYGSGWPLVGYAKSIDDYAKEIADRYGGSIERTEAKELGFD
jgi:hypothetical protein